MANVQTVKNKADTAKGYKIINRADYDAKEHKLVEGEQVPSGEAALNNEERKALDEMNAKRKVEANRGITGGESLDTSRNPSGTYSEPTPTDIRYPNKYETEFESNLGAQHRKSAAQMRQDQGLPDEPGGLNPDKHKAEVAKVDTMRLESKRLRDGEDATRPEQKSEHSEEDANLDKMTVAELRDYADDHDVDLGDATLKADILKKLKQGR